MKTLSIILIIFVAVIILGIVIWGIIMLTRCMNINYFNTKFLPDDNLAIVMVGKSTKENADKYAKWEMTIGLHRNSPSVVVILGNEIFPKDSNILDLDKINTDEIKELAMKWRELPKVSWDFAKKTKFDVGILGGLGPLASAVSLQHLIRYGSVGRNIIVCSFVRMDNNWETRDIHFFKLNCLTIIIACNSYHENAKNMIPKEKPIIKLYEQCCKYIKTRFAKEDSLPILLCGTDTTIDKKGNYYQQLKDFALTTDSSVQSMLWDTHDHVISSNYDKAISSFLQAIDISIKKGYKGIILGCTEFSVAAEWVRKSKKLDSIDQINKEIAIIDPLFLAAQYACNCEFKWSSSLNCNYCQCFNNDTYSNTIYDCSNNLRDFPYMKGGWKTVDECLSFLPHLIKCREYAAQWIKKLHITGIIEFGPYSVPVSHWTPFISEKNIILIDPLTRIEKIKHSDATILRTDFNAILPFRNRVQLGAKPIAIIMGAEVQDETLIKKIAKFIEENCMYIFLEAAWKNSCLPCEKTIKNLLELLPEFKIIEEMEWNHSELHLNYRTQCFHEDRKSWLLSRK